MSAREMIERQKIISHIFIYFFKFARNKISYQNIFALYYIVLYLPVPNKLSVNI